VEAVTKYVARSDAQIKCRVPGRAKYGVAKVTVATPAGANNAMSFRVRRQESPAGGIREVAPVAGLGFALARDTRSCSSPKIHLIPVKIPPHQAGTIVHMGGVDPPAARTRSPDTGGEPLVRPARGSVFVLSGAGRHGARGRRGGAMTPHRAARVIGFACHLDWGYSMRGVVS
jgi:hypothetical protein